jgi:hypothetical protein
MKFHIVLTAALVAASFNLPVLASDFDDCKLSYQPPNCGGPDTSGRSGGRFQATPCTPKARGCDRRNLL